jgi:hypothetical protein
MCRELGVKRLPGVPDFNSACGELGQVLLNPPTVAGWAQGRSWITPGMLLARGNLARQMLLPDMINFVDPNLDPGPQIREVNNRILRGMSVTAATSEENPGTGMADDRAMANVLADKEDFNTRYGSLNGWREAVRKVKPTLRVLRSVQPLCLRPRRNGKRRLRRPPPSCSAASACRLLKARSPWLTLNNEPAPPTSKAVTRMKRPAAPSGSLIIARRSISWLERLGIRPKQRLLQ